MITNIVMLAKIISGNPLKEEVIAFILCLLIPVATSVLYIALKKNRTKKNMLRYFSVTAAVLLVSDILLYLYFFDNGSYINRGMSGVWVGALPLVFMIFNFIIQTTYNYLKKLKKSVNNC